MIDDETVLQLQIETLSMAGIDQGTSPVYEVRVPDGLKPGDQFTLGLPDGAVRTLTVPAGVRGGMTFHVSVEPTVLEKVADAAKRAAAALQQKAKEEQWEAKAKAAASTIATAGANFIAGFKQGLAADPAPASAPAAHGQERLAAPPRRSLPAARDQPPPYAAPPGGSHDATSRVVVCIVPDGLEPGSQMLVPTPVGMMQTTVPPGLRPGSELHVRY